MGQDEFVTAKLAPISHDNIANTSILLGLIINRIRYYTDIKCILGVCVCVSDALLLTYWRTHREL